MHYIGKLDRAKFSCVTADIASDEVIITDERVRHIKNHHPGHYEIISPFLQIVLNSPDYILQDENPNTGVLLKRIEENGLRIQVVLRLHTSVDPEGFKNSVISAWMIREKEFCRLMRRKIVLYKAE